MAMASATLAAEAVLREQLALPSLGPHTPSMRAVGERDLLYIVVRVGVIVCVAKLAAKGFTLLSRRHRFRQHDHSMVDPSASPSQGHMPR